MYGYKCPGCKSEFREHRRIGDRGSAQCTTCGKTAPRDWEVEFAGFKQSPTTNGYPRKSRALGVMPSQRKQAMKDFESMGIPTHVDGEGNVDITSRKHDKELQEAMGVYNQDGGYGDAQRNGPNSSKLRRERIEA